MLGPTSVGADDVVADMEVEPEAISDNGTSPFS